MATPIHTIIIHINSIITIHHPLRPDLYSRHYLIHSHHIRRHRQECQRPMPSQLHIEHFPAVVESLQRMGYSCTR